MAANISAIVIRTEPCEQCTIYICILYDKRDMIFK
jgi:formate dehydrogenase maturation protein FdhE